MGQRTGNYRGGIQSGTTAASAASVKLEQHVRDAITSFKGRHGVTWSPKLSGTSIASCLRLSHIPGLKLPGVQPAGGIWLASDGDAPLLAVEAKKQGPLGNAIERWFKNWAVLSAIGVRIYVTFCSGDGFFDGNIAQRTLELAVALEPTGRAKLPDRVWNNPEGRLWFYRYRTSDEAADIPHVISRALDAACGGAGL